MKTKSIFFSILCIFVLTAYSANLFAQTDQQKLTATILHVDSAFWNAYNNCDTTQFKNFITDDFEFYHDKGGITTGASSFAASLSKNLCSKASYRLRREAVPGTVKVYPMHNGNELYGAIIMGEHLFYITQNGKPEFPDGHASFTHLWVLVNSDWKMKRVLSYDHHAAEYSNARKQIILPDKELDQLAGAYKGAQSGTMILVRAGHVLILKDNKNSYTLYPQSNASFFSKERDLIFDFIKDANNKPVKMIVKEHGAVADELLFEK